MRSSVATAQLPDQIRGLLGTLLPSCTKVLRRILRLTCQAGLFQLLVFARRASPGDLGAAVTKPFCMRGAGHIVGRHQENIHRV